eukprot:TRINITY_DN23006_c0_g1_i1.p1 TRINITY_DN23006_c0_g1~~TRINITY_DN23006_c0_g1_i1.p1  ORF type:complete len:576 (-),score=85.54 TRINITY_DN23006_c0_g1_i1:94-1821(-)
MLRLRQLPLARPPIGQPRGSSSRDAGAPQGLLRGLRGARERGPYCIGHLESSIFLLSAVPAVAAVAQRLEGRWRWTGQLRCTASQARVVQQAVIVKQKYRNGDGHRTLQLMADDTYTSLGRFSKPAAEDSRSTFSMKSLLDGSTRADIVAAGGKFARHVFLPVDYPSSVSPNYMEFSKAMAMQIFFSNISKVLATQAMLLAVGVGSKTALPMAAVTAWVLKDGIGHLLAIGFGTVVNTRFDSDPKRYRFFAAVAGKVADVVSILTLYRPDLFLLFSALGGACGRVSTSTASSCRAKIYETLSRSNNLGDVLRCSTAQSTAAQLIGTAGGACLGPFIGADVGKLLLTNFGFSAVGLFYAYRSSSLVEMTTLNEQRFEVLLLAVLPKILQLGSSSSEADLAAVSRALLTPSEVQAQEVFVRAYKSAFTGAPLTVNPFIQHERHIMFKPEWDAGAAQPPYIVGAELPGAEVPGGNSPAAVAVWYTVGCKPEMVLAGFFHACVFRALLARAAQHPEPVHSDVGLAQLSELHAQADTVSRTWWPHVADGLEKHGWRTDIAFLDAKDDRVHIDSQDAERSN